MTILAPSEFRSLDRKRTPSLTNRRAQLVAPPHSAHHLTHLCFARAFLSHSAGRTGSANAPQTTPHGVGLRPRSGAIVLHPRSSSPDWRCPWAYSDSIRGSQAEGSSSIPPGEIPSFVMPHGASLGEVHDRRPLLGSSYGGYSSCDSLLQATPVDRARLPPVSPR